MRRFFTAQKLSIFNVPTTVEEIRLPTQRRWKYVISGIGNRNAEGDWQALVGRIEVKVQGIAASRRGVIVVECAEIETADTIGAAYVSSN